MSVVWILAALSLGIWSVWGVLYLRRKQSLFESWQAVFEPANRDDWQKPNQVLDLCCLTPTSVVADVGAATGYFTRKLAARVPSGKVIAVEIEPTIAAHLAKHLGVQGLRNVVVQSALPHDPQLPEQVDCVLMVNTYRFVQKRSAFNQALHKSIRPGGRWVVVDFLPGPLPLGPPEARKLAASVVKQEAALAGFSLHSESALPYQYVLVFTR